MRVPFPLLIAAALAAACGPGGDPGAEAPAGEAAVSADAAPAPADLPTLVADIRAGIAEIPDMAATDHVAARRRAVELYGSRQEVLEAHWGPRGDRAPSVELGRAVEEAEKAFHDLMTLLNQETAPPASDVARAVAALDLRQEAVLRIAGESSGAEPESP